MPVEVVLLDLWMPSVYFGPHRPPTKATSEMPVHSAPMFWTMEGNPRGHWANINYREEVKSEALEV